MIDEADTSDAALARRAVEGDDRAFSQLVQRHKDGLYRLLRRYTGDPDEAYEAAHEAFISAWSALGRFDPDRPFGAWLRTIAMNKARYACAASVKWAKKWRSSTLFSLSSIFQCQG